MAIRIYALAKELKLDSKQLVDYCNKAGVQYVITNETTQRGKTVPGIGDLPGLDEGQTEIFRESVVIMPWQYDSLMETDHGPTDYNTMGTFSYLAQHGFKFAYAHTLIDNAAVNQRFKRQAGEFAIMARGYFRSSCIGYAGVHWGDTLETDAVYSIWFLYNVNYDEVPPNDYGMRKVVSVRW